MLNSTDRDDIFGGQQWSGRMPVGESEQRNVLEWSDLVTWASIEYLCTFAIDYGSYRGMSGERNDI
jgi:hypothetical protein